MSEYGAESLDMGDEITLSAKKWQQVLQYLDQRYVDEVSYEQITDEAIVNALKSLDPHSKYVSSHNTRAYNDALDGSYAGVGVELLEYDGHLFVKQVYRGSPASEVSIQPGDEILQVDGMRLGESDSLTTIILEMLRGFRPSDLTLTLRQKEGKIRDVQIYKDFVSIPSIYAANHDPEVGYIRLDRFAKRTYPAFMEAIEKVVDQGAQHLIIDVRDNPGGYLRQVMDILCQFYPEKDRVLVYTEGINAKRIEYKTTGRVFHPIERIAVLINGRSASGSEVLAATIQDTDRGIVVGEPTYGKGLVQEKFELIDRSEIRLTTSRYFTPSGRSIQKTYPTASIPVINDWDSVVYHSKNGRVLESQCGVLPDYFVLDTTMSSAAEKNILSCCFSLGVFSPSQIESHRVEIENCLSDKSDAEWQWSWVEEALLKLESPDKALTSRLKSDPVYQSALRSLKSENFEEVVLRSKITE